MDWDRVRRERARNLRGGDPIGQDAVAPYGLPRGNRRTWERRSHEKVMGHVVGRRPDRRGHLRSVRSPHGLRQRARSEVRVDGWAALQDWIGEHLRSDRQCLVLVHRQRIAAVGGVAPGMPALALHRPAVLDQDLTALEFVLRRDAPLWSDWWVRGFATGLHEQLPDIARLVRGALAAAEPSQLRWWQGRVAAYLTPFAWFPSTAA